MSEDTEWTFVSFQETYDAIIEGLDSEGRFFFTRFGDVDLMMAHPSHMGKTLGNNKTVVTDPLRREMVQSLNVDDPMYLKAVGGQLKAEQEEQQLRRRFWLTPRVNKYSEEGRELWHILSTTNTCESPVYYDVFVFIYMSLFRPGMFRRLMHKHLVDKRKMYVGGTGDDGLEKFFGKMAYTVEVPERGACASLDEWYPSILEKIWDVDVLLLACGNSARLIQYRLWNQGVPIKSLDIGSWYDMLVGNRIRKWVKFGGYKVAVKALRSLSFRGRGKLPSVLNKPKTRRQHGEILMREVLRRYQYTPKPDAFVETGTGFGNTTDVVNRMVGEFREVHTIEMSPQVHAKVKRAFGYTRVNLHCGSSLDVLPKLLENLRYPVVFYLDAHFCDGHDGAAESFPLWEELDLLINRKQPDVFMIDDVHAFGEEKPELGEHKDVWKGITGATLLDRVGRETVCNSFTLQDCFVIMRTDRGGEDVR